MRRLAIGDIHGCYEEFQALLDQAGLSADDEIIALGDIVDRGPDSVRMLEFFQKTPRARSLMGNHERKHVRSFRGEIRPALSQRITREQIGDAAYPAACAFMEALPRFLDLPEATLIHGFLEPGVPLREQRENVLVGTLSGEAYIEERCGPRWYELYEGAKPLIVAHRDYLEDGEPLIYRDQVYCLDTNCCRGGALTGLLLPEFRILSVRSRANHWAETEARWAHLRLESTSTKSLDWEQLGELVAALESRATLAPDAAARRAAARALADEAERALSRLHHHIQETNARLLAELRAETAYDQLTPNQQGSLYATRAGQGPLSALLHLARQGRMSLEALRNAKALRRPATLVEFVRQLGI